MEQFTNECESFSPYISYEKFVCDKVIFQGIVTKSHYDSTNKCDNKYHIIPLLYKYKIPENLVIEACEMETNIGIIKREKSPNEFRYIISANLHPSYCEPHKIFINAMESLYNACITAIDKNKMQVGMYNFNVKSAKRHFNPITSPRTNEITGEIILDTPHHITLKLSYRSNKTTFTDLNDNEVPWELLEDINMRFIPLLQFKHINITNSLATIIFEVVKSVITNVEPIKIDIVKFLP